jgi:hypothetical protein
MALKWTAVPDHVSVIGAAARPKRELRFWEDSAIVSGGGPTVCLDKPITARLPHRVGRRPATPSLSQGEMINLHEFRSGQFSVPFSCGDELPECCFACVYLLYDNAGSCLCGSGFNYFCGYAWPDKLNQTVPPCLLDPE